MKAWAHSAEHWLNGYILILWGTCNENRKYSCCWSISMRFYNIYTPFICLVFGIQIISLIPQCSHVWGAITFLSPSGVSDSKSGAQKNWFYWYLPKLCCHYHKQGVLEASVHDQLARLLWARLHITARMCGRAIPFTSWLRSKESIF